jgi:hypothetical protein
MCTLGIATQPLVRQILIMQRSEGNSDEWFERRTQGLNRPSRSGGNIMTSTLRFCMVSLAVAAATACGGDDGADPSVQALGADAERESSSSVEAVSASPDEDPVEPAYAADPCKWSVSYDRETSLTHTRGTGFSALGALVAFNEPGHGTIHWHDGTTSGITFSASARGNSATVDDPPRNEGYCTPTLTVPVELRLATDDGRLTEVVLTSLTAVGYDGIVETVFVDAGLPIDDLRGELAIPEDWLISGHSVRRIDLDLHRTRAGGTPAYCLPGEERSTDPADGCNAYDGVVRFYSSVEDPWADEVAAPDEISHQVVGWWTLDG